MAVLAGLQPENVFEFFEEISSIPRPSFHCEKISEYCVEFGKKKGLFVSQDEMGNVIIKKPGTKGYENAQPVILQGHLDMVAEKVGHSTHDFMEDGLDLYIEDGFIKAKDTTLGADNGIAVAMVLALLDGDSYKHPPIEAVFTVDEETGMGGAHALDFSQLSGKRLINLDSEEEGILTAGCSGGFRFQFDIPMEKETVSGSLVDISIHGLKGGHSGQEINLQRGNAHKMMGRFLSFLLRKTEFYLLSLEGGSKDNVISMISTAKILVAEGQEHVVEETVEYFRNVWEKEFGKDEPDLAVDLLIERKRSESVFTKESTKRGINFVEIIPNGVFEFSRSLKDLVETSSNLGFIHTGEKGISGACMVRSSIDSKMEQLKDVLYTSLELCQGNAELSGEYPGWKYKEESPLRNVMTAVYRKLFHKEPEVMAVHAGLECGLFLGKNPDLDCISCGPEMFDVHSVRERLSIASTKNTWEYLLAVLEELND